MTPRRKNKRKEKTMRWDDRDATKNRGMRKKHNDRRKQDKKCEMASRRKLKKNGGQKMIMRLARIEYTNQN